MFASATERGKFQFLSCFDKELDRSLVSPPSLALYGRPKDFLTAFESPVFADTCWHWPASDVRVDEPVEKILIPPPPLQNPNPKRSYPQAQEYHLKADDRFTRGYRYGTPFLESQKDILKARMLSVDSVPQVIPRIFDDGTVQYDPLPGMVRMVPGVPFTYEMPDSEMVVTIGCLHTPDSLREYGKDGLQALAFLEEIYVHTFGRKGDETQGLPEIKPIYSLPNLKRNARSGPAVANCYDGSYSLASTVGDGEGSGCFLPAAQNDTMMAKITIGPVLRLLHDTWRILFPKSVSKMEYDLVEFDSIDNNTFSFGGLDPGPTSLQMNVTSQGRSFKEAIGAQGSWHTDFNDCPLRWSMIVMLLRIPLGVDPGTFTLGRSGLFVRHGDYLIVVLFMKGQDMHCGGPPYCHPSKWESYIQEVAHLYDSTDSTNRVVYVCYPSRAATDRFTNMAVTPSTHFGNANATLPHKISQRTFATHGEYILGGVEVFANRLGREAFYNFWNTLQLCGLTLDLDPNHILANIFYMNGKTRTRLLPNPDGYHPIHNRDWLVQMRAYYQWYTGICNHILIPIHKSEYKKRLAATMGLNDKLQGLPGVPQPTALCHPIQQSEEQSSQNPRSIDKGKRKAVSTRITSMPLAKRPHRTTTSPVETNMEVPTEQGQSGPEYEVEEILSYRLQFNEGPQWLIKWKDYDSRHNCWCSIHELENCKEMLASYNEEHGIEAVEGYTQGVYSFETISRLKSLFDSERLRKELESIRAEHQAEEGVYPRVNDSVLGQTLKTVRQSITGRAAQNAIYREAYQNIHATPGQSLLTIFSQFSTVGASLPEATENLRILTILGRAQKADICRTLLIVYDWFSSSGPRIATYMVSDVLKGSSGDFQELYPQVASLVDLVIRYVRKYFQHKDPKEKRREKRTGVTPISEPDIPSRIEAADFERYGLTQEGSQRRLPKFLDLPTIAPHRVTHENTSLTKACTIILVDLWAAFYIEPHVKAMDPILVGTSSTKRKTDWIARAICRGAVLTRLVECFGSESIFYSSEIDWFLRTPWVVFGNAGKNNNRARIFSTQSINNARELLAPMASILKATLAENETSKTLADEIYQIIYKDLLSTGHESHAQGATGSRRTTTGRTPRILQPVWGQVSSECLIPSHDSAMLKPIALILREALNYRLNQPYEEEILHRILTGHDPTSIRPVPNDQDHFDPIRQFSQSAELFRKHLSPLLLVTSHGLSNLFAWFSTDSLLSKFDQGLTHNKALSHAGKPILVTNTRVWGQPSSQLSLFSYQVEGVTEKEAMDSKISTLFSDDIRSRWKDFLGSLYNQDPSQYTGPRHSWLECTHFLRSFMVDGFKSDTLTMLQCANSLAFAGIVDPPDIITMGSWIFNHTGLGAYRGLNELGFKISNITEAVAAFAMVHNHLLTHIGEDGKNTLGMASDCSAIAVEHILCKVTRWTKVLKGSQMSWDDFECHTQSSPIPLMLSEKLIDDVITWTKTLG
ncbi:hypothetical protein PTI98_007631 [Pleurotus ostreatus]|nr:hypothetical protein PTI98_007631 [Pleurotus ostreatus]